MGGVVVMGKVLLKFKRKSSRFFTLFIFSGAGGQAGDPGQAGSGGDGQDGAEIIIRTNDPVVFMAMEVNVQGGKGGEGGLPGKEGQRGEGGAGGQGGMACTWQEPMNNGTSVVYVAKSSKPGKSGRAGRKGKAGRKIKAARASSGSNGTYGRFSLCLYEGDVLIESAGMPYRLMIDQKLEKKLHPVSLLGGKDDKEAKSFYIFGNKISLGPILPINIGCLSCPPPSLKCSLFLFRPGCPMVNASAAPVVFPPLPESRDTRYGELPQKEAKTVIIDVPSLSASGFLPDKLMMGPPWANKWSEAAKCTGKIIVQMCIEDIPFRRIETDKKFQCEKVFDNLCFDIPIEITKQSDNQALLIPASIGMSDFSVETTILVSVANKVDCKLPTMGELALAVAGDSFRPIVAGVDGELASKDIPGGDGPTKYIAHEYRRAIPQLDRKETATFLYTVKLPAIADANSRAVQPGSHIAVQPQLYVDGVLAQFGPASFMRVAPPLPPSQNVEYKDILFFSFVDMQPSDYSILTAVSEAIGHKAHFLDCHHYMSRMNGIPGPVPAALWAGHVGKGVVVWVPPTASDNTLIPEQELFTHVQRGGHLICSGKATFKWNSSGSAPPTQESRRVILAGEQLRLWKIGSERVISGQEIDGTSLNILVLSIISSLSIDKKLQLLVDNRIICNMKLGNVLLPNYTIEVEAGCSCFGKKKTKVVPLQKTPCLLHDCILSAIVTDLTMDLAYFESHPRKDLCYSIQAIIRFVAKEIVNKKNTLEVSLLGRDIAAVFHASEIFEFSSTFRNKNSKTVWESFLLEINNAAYSCMNIATAKKLDYGGLGERLKEIEIVTSFTRMGGKSRKVHKLVEGVKHSFDVQKK